MPDVTCVGVLVADVIVRPVEAWPERGRLVRVESIEVHSGGLAHTTGVILAKLGVPTAVVGRAKAAGCRTTQLSNAVGAMCVTAIGGTTGIRTMAETLRFAETTPVRG